MKTLAITYDVNGIGYSLFDKTNCVGYAFYRFQNATLPSVLLELEMKLTSIIQKELVSLVVVERINTDINDKIAISLRAQLLGVIKLTCRKNKTLFQQMKVDGWFKQITKGTNTYLNKKRILDELGYEIELDDKLTLDEKKTIIDMLLLGDSMVNGKLQIGGE